MKKVIVIVITLMIVGVTCANAQARRHHRNNDTDVLAGFLGGVIVGIMTDGNRYYGGRGYYDYNQQRQAEMQRARQHERVIQQYENCLAQRRVDIYYGVPPQQAKDCSRYHPSNRSWNY